MDAVRPGDEVAYRQRSDSTGAKIALLEEARRRGDYRLALALADSLKDGLTAEWLLAGQGAAAGPDAMAAPDLGADGWRPVSDLPAEWASWASGWEWCRPLHVAEPAGVAREGEPVDVTIATPAAWCRSLAHELRVAEIDPHSGTLRQVVSQVYGETRTRQPAPGTTDQGRDDRAGETGVRTAHLAWLASIPAHETARYLVFCGNPAAEQPEYTSDLQTRGAGYALEIENDRYIATLSAQTGQLERLRYKRAHGLELFAGGEGHGEPPHIDWAHDYLAAGKFQKFRVTNWESVPNYEVIRGPVCTIVRRWGFPHSPLHPVFTAARMLVDVSYVFYAGAPYFLKHGTMEAVRDFSLNYLRDDEWVFSGYSFTDLLWMDRDGRVHEGPVPPEHAEEMWGVGFFHRESGDSFFSIRLDHRLTRAGTPDPGTPGAPNDESGDPILRHADAPSLSYKGHGQLWSRWALRGDPRLRAGDTLHQRNAYVVEPHEAGAGAPLEQLRRRLLSPLVVSEDPDASFGTDVPRTGAQTDAQTGALAGPGEGIDARPLKAALWDALRQVRDDMFYTVDASVSEMGYVSDLRVRDGVVELLFTMPHRGRPRYRYLSNPAAARLAQVPGVRSVVVTPVWDPAWTPHRMSDAAWTAMGLDQLQDGQSA